MILPNAALSRPFSARRAGVGIVGLRLASATRQRAACLAHFVSVQKRPIASLFSLDVGPLCLRENASHWTAFKLTALGNITLKGYRAIYDHLSGSQTVGLYPLTHDDACYLLAVDFDKSDWQAAARAFSSVCNELDIPHAIERSRSGNGAHIWLFFEKKIAARDARRLGSALLDQAMERYPGLSFESYDRMALK